MITIAHESVGVLFDDALHLLLQHNDELKERPLAIRQDQYLQMEQAGVLICFIARSAGVIVGYAVFYCCEDPKHGTPMAVSDAIYLHPDHRRAMNGIKLIKYADDHLQTFGIRRVDFLVSRVDFGPVLERLGFKQTEVVYSKGERWAAP